MLAAETELSRVRGEIESIKGRRRVLADQVALASVALHVNVRSPYVAAVSTSLGTRAGDAFLGSVGAMGSVARGTVIVGAAAAPWLGVLFALALLTAATLRRVVRRTPVSA